MEPIPDSLGEALPEPSPAPSSFWDNLRASPWACAMLSVLAAGAVGCGLMALSVKGYENYGITLFCLSPAICSFLAVILHQWARPASGERIWPVTGAVVGVMAVIASLGLLLAAGAEGFICIAMALPFALILSLIGAVFGQAVVMAFDGRPQQLPIFTLVVLLYPAAQGYEARHPAPAVPQLITTQVVVEAPPQRVWATLVQPVQYPAYPAATGWFRAGVVYPTRTALAYDAAGNPPTLVCHYSQGLAHLPVAVWQPGRQLTFAVPPAVMPAPMREISPYPQIHAPHLHGYFQVDSGTFRLRPLPGGRTLLEARTVYRHSIGPRFYWQLWSDYLLDAMHQRVLATLKAAAEATPRHE